MILTINIISLNCVNRLTFVIVRCGVLFEVRTEVKYYLDALRLQRVIKHQNIFQSLSKVRMSVIPLNLQLSSEFTTWKFVFCEELLELIPMHGTTTCEGIFCEVERLLQKYELPLSELVFSD
jgi:hypothetical protein